MTIPTNNEGGLKQRFLLVPSRHFPSNSPLLVVEVAASVARLRGTRPATGHRAPGTGHRDTYRRGSRAPIPGSPARVSQLALDKAYVHRRWCDVGECCAVAGSRGAVSPAGRLRATQTAQPTRAGRVGQNRTRPVGARKRLTGVMRAETDEMRLRSAPGTYRGGARLRVPSSLMLSCSGRGRRGSCLRVWRATTRNPRALMASSESSAPSMGAMPALNVEVSRSRHFRPPNRTSAATPRTRRHPHGPAPETPASHLRTRGP